jgi:hypothetical protein
VSANATDPPANNPHFADSTPAAICTQLLDSGPYLSSVHTMYRFYVTAINSIFSPGIPSGA